MYSAKSLPLLAEALFCTLYYVKRSKYSEALAGLPAAADDLVLAFASCRGKLASALRAGLFMPTEIYQLN